MFESNGQNDRLDIFRYASFNQPNNGSPASTEFLKKPPCIDEIPHPLHKAVYY